MNEEKTPKEFIVCLPSSSNSKIQSIKPINIRVDFLLRKYSDGNSVYCLIIYDILLFSYIAFAGNVK